MSATSPSVQNFSELRAITHEMGSALMNVASATILLQSACFEDPKAAERLQIVVAEVNRLVGLHERQRRILQGYKSPLSA